MFPLLTALLLALSITACGGKETNNSHNDAQQTPPVTEDNGTITDDSSHQDTSSGVPLDEMLENARVHDRDGDLLDGENHTTRNTAHG